MTQLTEDEIKRFRIGDILFNDEQAKMFCDLALKGLRAEALPSSSTVERCQLADEIERVVSGDDTEAYRKVLFAPKNWRLIVRALRGYDEISLAPSATASAWIPVNERLPSPHTDDDFIVATISGYVTALNFGEHGWYSGFSSDDEEKAKDGYWNGCVTHWRTMPAAPAENKATTL